MNRTLVALLGTVIGSGLLAATLPSPAAAQNPIEIRASAPEKPQRAAPWSLSSR